MDNLFIGSTEKSLSPSKFVNPIIPINIFDSWPSINPEKPRLNEMIVMKTPNNDCLI